MQKDALAVLEQARREADESEWLQEQEDADGQNGHTPADENPAPVAMETLKAYNAGLLDWPEGFAPNSKLERLLKRRADISETERGIDWGQAEALAFASILADGTRHPVDGSGF